MSANNRGNHGLDVIARVRSTLTIDQARADMQTLTASIIEEIHNTTTVTSTIPWCSRR